MKNIQNWEKFNELKSETFISAAKKSKELNNKNLYDNFSEYTEEMRIKEEKIINNLFETSTDYYNDNIDEINKKQEEYEIKKAFQYFQQNKMIELKEMIENGFDVNSKNEKGDTLLISCGHYTKFKILKILLEYGADINFQDNNGNTLLFKAVMFGNTETISFLLQNNIDWKHINKNGENFVDRIIRKNDKEIIELIKLNYPDIYEEYKLKTDLDKFNI